MFNQKQNSILDILFMYYFITFIHTLEVVKQYILNVQYQVTILVVEAPHQGHG